MDRDVVLPAPTVVPAGVDGVALRPWESSDVAALRAIANDPLIIRWSPLVRGDQGVEAWIARRAVWDDQMSWAIVDAHDEILGCVSVWLFDWHAASASVGYWMAPEHRGRGIATKAVTLATRFAFDHTPLVRLTLCHAIENAASCRVADRAGFPLEGTTRLSWRYPDGALHDEHLHAIVRTDLR